MNPLALIIDDEVQIRRLLRVALESSGYSVGAPAGGTGLGLSIARRVIVDGNEISLTATEYALLRLLVRHAGRVLTHSQMLREVWGPNAEEHRQYLRVYVTHLRRKIERDPQHPVHIKTESGIGYRLLSGG